jgi:hypothetical protein
MAKATKGFGMALIAAMVGLAAFGGRSSNDQRNGYLEYGGYPSFDGEETQDTFTLCCSSPIGRCESNQSSSPVLQAGRSSSRGEAPQGTGTNCYIGGNAKTLLTDSRTSTNLSYEQSQLKDRLA